MRTGEQGSARAPARGRGAGAVVGAVALGLVLAGACGGGAVEAPTAPDLATSSLAKTAAEPTRVGVSEGGVPASRDGLDRIGVPAPAWGEMEWIGSEPLTLADLRGRVVLIRFWTDTCPFCRATAPALAEIDADHRARGVTVIGMYHPKPRGSSRSKAAVAEAVAAFGWRFPVAIDAEWAALDAFWLAHRSRDYTSVSFVLDREGVVRYVHPGGEFHPGGPADHEGCRRDYADVRAALEALLAEAPDAPGSADPAASRASPVSAPSHASLR